MNGHAIWLSFVPLGGRLKLSGRVKTSSCGAGAMAILTASSNRSNSTSLIALSNLKSAEILTVRIVIFPKTTDAPLRVMIETF
jgi:hypothetical protein